MDLMKIAICCDIQSFEGDSLRDREWASRFPGSGWITSLYERQTSLSIEIASGDVALQRVKSGQWRAGDVQVVQELDARHGMELCRLGAEPAVLTVFESPLIAYRSLDRLVRSSVGFAHCIGPRPLFERMPAQQRAAHWPLTFPNHWQDQTVIPVPWSERRYTILVAANKYWREPGLDRIRSAKQALRWLRHGLRKQFSTTYGACRNLQLHDVRLALLEHLAVHGQIDVFGAGWENRTNLPRDWENRLAPVSSIFRGRCGDKFDLVRHYRFTIAFENTTYPGYVTEKLGDSLVAMAVPIYYGAPDVTVQFPRNVFLDAHALGSPSAIADRLQQITESEAMDMLAAGQMFLRSPQGQRYSYEGFGEWIVSLLHGKEGRG